ncbi:hypothetical protein [Nocardia sp. NPDC003963]
MTTPTSIFPPRPRNTEKIAEIARARRRARNGLRLRLAVLGTSMDDAVSAVGGWMFDRSMAGWDVVVVAGDLGDPRPARILGAGAVDLESALTQRPGPTPHALAISAALLATESRLRGRVQECIDHGPTEVSIWGQPHTGQVAGRTNSTTHRLSHAARYFKYQAVCAVGGEVDIVRPTEDFRTGAVRWYPPREPTPAGASPAEDLLRRMGSPEATYALARTTPGRITSIAEHRRAPGHTDRRANGKEMP